MGMGCYFLQPSMLIFKGIFGRFLELIFNLILGNSCFVEKIKKCKLCLFVF